MEQFISRKHYSKSSLPSESLRAVASQTPACYVHIGINREMRTTIPKAGELDALSQAQKVEYFNVNGVPVAAIDDVEVYRYDTPTPERFPSTSIMDDGVEITKEEFTALLPPAS